MVPPTAFAESTVLCPLQIVTGFVEVILTTGLTGTVNTNVPLAAGQFVPTNV